MQKILIALVSMVFLMACKNHATIGPNTLNLDHASVHSWHLGQNAQGESYLLVVLNQDALGQLKNNPKLRLNLGQQAFKHPTDIQGGFLVLHPLAADWNTNKIKQLLD